MGREVPRLCPLSTKCSVLQSAPPPACGQVLLGIARTSRPRYGVCERGARVACAIYGHLYVDTIFVFGLEREEKWQGEGGGGVYGSESLALARYAFARQQRPTLHESVGVLRGGEVPAVVHAGGAQPPRCAQSSAH